MNVFGVAVGVTEGSVLLATGGGGVCDGGS